VVAVLVILFLGLVFVAHRVYMRKVNMEHAIETAQLEQERVKKDIKKIEERYKNIVELKQLVDTRIKVLRVLDPPHRILWTEKLYMLARLTPTNVFLTQLTLKESRPRGSRAPASSHQVLTIRGYSYGMDDAERMRNITKFIEAMQSFYYVNAAGKVSRFMDNFEESIKLAGAMVTKKIEGVEVVEFSFNINTLPTKTD
jgi:hypothetical protein